MRRGISIVLIFALSAKVLAASPPALCDSVVKPLSGEPATLLSFPGAKSTPLQLDITIQGRSPLAEWHRFLDELFDYFDRNGDGSLSPAEVQRMFALPALVGRHVPVNFAKLDADRSGSASREEFRAYCLAEGFGPVAVMIGTPAAEDVELGAWWSKIAARPDLQMDEFLREFDLDENEYLDRDEMVLAAEKVATPKKKFDGARVLKSAERAASLRIDLDAKAATVELVSSKDLRLVRPASAGGLHRLDGPGWCVVFRTTRLLPDIRSSREFLVAQFETVLGDRKEAKKGDIDDDALRDLFDFADRDGNGLLSLGELTNYLQLIEKGARAQTVINVIDRGRNPFYRLDSDADRRLSLKELGGMKELGKALPRQFEIAFMGPLGVRWGGVLVRSPKGSVPTRDAAGFGPRWFDAMDRNQDGFLSPREFLGPVSRFRELDLDGDGLVSREEARKIQGPR